jgi:hypothetical protein
MALPMNEADIFEDVNDELAGMTPEDILRRSRLLENEIRVLKVRKFSNHFSLSLFLSSFLCFFSLLCVGFDVEYPAMR